MSAPTCSECPRPIPDGSSPNRKTCCTACADAREARLCSEKRENDRPLYTRLCIICGREFKPLNSQQRVCPDTNCRLTHRKDNQRKNYRAQQQQTPREPQPQMFLGDPWDTDRPVYVLGDMTILSHHAYLGTDPLPSGPSPLPYKPARIKGVYRKEPKK